MVPTYFKSYIGKLSFAYCVFITVLTVTVVTSEYVDSEPVCLSRFDYDFKIVKKLAALEIENERQATSIGNLLERLSTAEAKVKHNYRLIQLLQDTGQSKDGSIRSGATYVRWGKTTCPGNGTGLVYKGQIGGSMNGHKGGAAEFLCLPNEPLWGVYDDRVQSSSAPVFGAEYQTEQRNTESFFGRELVENDIPCVVCRTERASAVMIPARNRCYDGWTREYAGYLMGGYWNHEAASQHICVDYQAEVLDKGGASETSKLLYFAEARCGSLRCPPYVNGRELTCVVCSK